MVMDIPNPLNNYSNRFRHGKDVLLLPSCFRTLIDRATSSLILPRLNCKTFSVLKTLAVKNRK